MSRLLFLFLIIVIGCSQLKKDQYTLVKGYVVKTDWVMAVRGYRKIQSVYEYSYNDSIYSNSIVMGKDDSFYKQGDSLLIKIKQEGEHNPVILNCFYRPPKSKKTMVSSISSDKELHNEASGKENEIVTFNKNKTSSTFGVSYYVVDTKPLFDGATVPDMNDSLINEYVKMKCNQDKQEYIKGTAVTISINEQGEVSGVKFFNTANENYNEYLRNIFLNMPQWQPGVRGGVNVVVAFNVVLE